jgi:hypothetical protein
MGAVAGGALCDMDRGILEAAEAAPGGSMSPPDGVEDLGGVCRLPPVPSDSMPLTKSASTGAC